MNPAAVVLSAALLAAAAGCGGADVSRSHLLRSGETVTVEFRGAIAEFTVDGPATAVDAVGDPASGEPAAYTIAVRARAVAGTFDLSPDMFEARSADGDRFVPVFGSGLAEFSTEDLPEGAQRDGVLVFTPAPDGAVIAALVLSPGPGTGPDWELATWTVADQ